VLLVGAGLFVASLRSASHYDLGWDSEHTAVVRLERGFSEGESGDTPALTRNQMWDLYARLEVALTRVPGVEGAARTASVPMGPSFRLPVLTPGSDTAPRLPSGPPDISAAAPGYFAVMRQPVLRGRAFRNSDLNETDEPVVVVNRALAEQVWPEQDALSSCLRVGGTTAPCARVVGVVETHTTSQLGEEPKMMVWVPIMRTPLRGVFGVVVRTAGDPTKRFGAIRDAALALSPGIRYVEVSRLADGVERQLRPWRLGADLCSIFGALALIVAVVGLYGLLAFEVAQRRFEMGIRATMGATRGTLIRHVMADGIATVAVGTSVGLAAAALTVPRLAPLLFGTSPWDGRVFAGVAVVLLLVAAASSWFPALKGGTVDPAEALRAE
jgi:putative ABC transport system permease protein